MADKSYRIASTLEVRHYRELLRPINDFLATHSARRGDMPVELIEITQAVFAEVARFAYVPTQEALLVAVDDSDSCFDAPSLDNAQVALVRAEMRALFQRLQPPV